MIKMKVPEWFAKVGTMTDNKLARQEQLDVPMVSAVRKALGVPMYRNLRFSLKRKLKPTERWNRYLRLRQQKVPKELWANALGFHDTRLFTAHEQLEEWLYCRRKKLHFNPRWPKKPSNVKKKRHYRIKSAKEKKLKQQPRGEAAPDTAERIDDSFEPGDVD